MTHRWTSVIPEDQSAGAAPFCTTDSESDPFVGGDISSETEDHGIAEARAIVTAADPAVTDIKIDLDPPESIEEDELDRHHPAEHDATDAIPNNIMHEIPGEPLRVTTSEGDQDTISAGAEQARSSVASHTLHLC